MKKYDKLLLIIILIFGGLLRFIWLDTNPPHLGNDEISIAYDSYSIRLINRDEYGNYLPVSFKSHQTYKSPLYAYFNIPFNYLFGNTEYGVRFLSALAGVLSIYFTYLIGVTISSSNIGLIGALLMATDPKSIFVSRIGYESNLASTILLIGIYGLLKFVKNRKILWLVVGSFFMGLSIWGYHTEWGLVPMMMFCIPIIFRKYIPITKWWLALTIVFIVSFPIYYNFVTVQKADSNNRARSQLWFSEGKFREYLINSNDSFFKKSVVIISTPIHSYLEHFGLDVNFASGSKLFNNKSFLDVGWFYLSCLPMIYFGLKYGTNYFGRWWTFLIFWWLLCPIVPSMTGSVAAVRNLPFIAPTILLLSAGLAEIHKRSKNIFCLVLVLFVFNFFMFCTAYYVHHPADSANNFQYGYKQAWEYIKPNINKYDLVVVENKFGNVGQFTGVPHLYFGYFGAFNVNDMQNRSTSGDLKINKFVFKFVDWNQEVFKPKTIYVVSVINPITNPLRKYVKLLGVIKNINNTNQFLVYETK